MDIMQITEQMFVFFLLILAGYGINRAGLMDQDLSKRLTALLIKVTIPCMILASVANRSHFADLRELLYTLIVFSLMNLAAPFAAFLLVKGLGIQENRRIFQFMLMLTNSAFLGFPVVQAVFGDIGLVYASIFLIPNNFLMFLYGESLFMDEKKTNWKKLLHPPILASLVACILCVANVRQPQVISSAFQCLGEITTPLAMLIIGSSLADIPWRGMLCERYIIRYTIAKMFVVPILYYVILSYILHDSIVVSAGVILMAMPPASNAVIFAEAHGKNTGLCSRLIFITSLISIFSIPLLCVVLF